MSVTAAQGLESRGNLCGWVSVVGQWAEVDGGDQRSIPRGGAVLSRGWGTIAGRVVSGYTYVVVVVGRPEAVVRVVRGYSSFVPQVR
jgi:hypothetical protein